MKNTIVSFCKDVMVRRKLDIINLFILTTIFILLVRRIIPIATFAVCIFFINSVRNAIESIACTDEKILQKNSLLCVVLARQQFTFYALMFIFTIMFYSITYHSEEINSVEALLILFTLMVIPILPLVISKLCKKLLKK